MINEILIDKLKKLIQLIELDKNSIINNYRIQSLKKSLKIIMNYHKQIKTGQDIQHIKGIGKGTIDRIDEIIRTGTLIELKNYDKVVNKANKEEPIIQDLMSVIGIGRIVAQDLIKKYKIKSAQELKLLSDSNKIQLNDKLKIGLKYLGKFHGTIPRTETDTTYDYIQDLTDKYNKSMFITICGSYRRELPTSSDIDILLCDLDIITMDDIINSNINYLSNYVNYLRDNRYIVDDITDKNIKTKYMGFCRLNDKSKIRRIDIRFIPMESYFTALLYFTGSFENNKIMRKQAKKLGYKLNEYGLYKNDEMLFVLSEQEIFHKLKMDYLSPNKR